MNTTGCTTPWTNGSHGYGVSPTAGCSTRSAWRASTSANPVGSTAISSCRWPTVLAAERLLDALVVSVFPIQRSDVGAAREIAILQPKLSARDGLHVAVMQANGVDSILTSDDGFSSLPGVTRLP